MATSELDQILEAGAAATERLAANRRKMDRAWGTGTFEDWYAAYKAEEFQDGSGSDDGGTQSSGGTG